MSISEWKEKDWKALILAIQQDNCILMLGPDSAVEKVKSKSRVLTEILANQLAEDLDPHIKEKINTANLSEVSQHNVLEKKLGRTDLEGEVQTFYQHRRSLCSQFHRDLAALPFYFIITSSPDYMFYEALKKENKEPVTARYHFKGKNPPILDIGKKERPLLFYLYGSIEETASLVITENDLLDFLAAIISKKPLPDRILMELNDKKKNFLFLGFGFKHWYQRILLHVLHDREKESRSFALERLTRHNVKELKSAVLFFQGSSSKIHIFKGELNTFAKELRKRYEESAVAPAAAPGIEAGKAPTVFICHANKDKAYAAALYEKMKNAGLKPWLDKENLRGGDKWHSIIEKTIKKQVDYFIVLQSKALAEKRIGYVNKEILLAIERQQYFRNLKFIIPIKVDDCLLLEELEDIQTIDFTREGTIEELIKTIKRDFMKRGN